MHLLLSMVITGYNVHSIYSSSHKNILYIGFYLFDYIMKYSLIETWLNARKPSNIWKVEWRHSRFFTLLFHIDILISGMNLA